MLTKLFIVGAPRSGTSILGLSMMKAVGLPGRGESHLMPVIARSLYAFRNALIQARKGDPNNAVMQFPPAEYEAAMFDVVRRHYARVYPAGEWMDKTPSGEAVMGAPMIREIFPDAHILCTRRSGIEVVKSTMKKFNAAIGPSCDNWIAAMTALSELRRRALPITEVEHRELLDQPMATAFRIANAIGKPDKSEALGHFLATNTIETSAARPGRMNAIDETGWDDAQKAVFEQKCGALMREYGYSY